MKVFSESQLCVHCSSSNHVDFLRCEAVSVEVRASYVRLRCHCGTCTSEAKSGSLGVWRLSSAYCIIGYLHEPTKHRSDKEVIDSYDRSTSFSASRN